MFFVLSKILWFFVNPTNVLFVLLLAGTAFLWTRWKHLARWILSIASLISLFAVTFPVGNQFNLFLENRFSLPESMPTQVDGVIVLGGTINQYVTKARGEVSVGGSFERVLQFSELSRQYPNAKLVYSGGSGSLTRQEVKEADLVSPLLTQLNVDTSRVVFENQSRNTYENAQLSFKLLNPKAHETWILITSARHMPRAMGCFRRSGWPNLVAYPTDFKFEGNEKFFPPLPLSEGLGSISIALHELLGLTFYYLTGKTDSWIPNPSG